MRVSTSRRSALTASSSSGDLAGALGVGGEQELEAGVGAVEAPGGVEPRREAEADRALVDAAGVDARDVHQRLQPGLAGAGEAAQAGAHEPAVLAGERDDVGDGGERDQVEVLVDGRRVLPRAGHQRLRELVGDAGRAQVRARVAADPRVHDRGVGQRAVGARRVVVGDHDLHARGARGGDLLDRGDRAVDRDQQVRSRARRAARPWRRRGRSRRRSGSAGTSRRRRRACAARARGSRSR